MVRNIKIALVITWLLGTAAYLYKLSIVNRYANSGVRLVELRTEAERLKLENIILENEIASHSSLRAVNEKAEKLGFKRSKVQYLKLK